MPRQCRDTLIAPTPRERHRGYRDAHPIPPFPNGAPTLRTRRRRPSSMRVLRSAANSPRIRGTRYWVLLVASFAFAAQRLSHSRSHANRSGALQACYGYSEIVCLPAGQASQRRSRAYRPAQIPRIDCPGNSPYRLNACSDRAYFHAVFLQARREPLNPMAAIDNSRRGIQPVNCLDSVETL